MTGAELHARCVHLILTGQDDHGLEWTGTREQWEKCQELEMELELQGKSAAQARKDWELLD